MYSYICYRKQRFVHNYIYIQCMQVHLGYYNIVVHIIVHPTCILLHDFMAHVDSVNFDLVNFMLLTNKITLVIMQIARWYFCI